METENRTTPGRTRNPAFAFVSLRRTFFFGLKSLWAHRLRSMLTMLGIVFGVCSVIAMLAVGEGASHSAQELIRQQGSNNVILKSVKPPEDETGSQGQSFTLQYGLTRKDLQRIRATIPTVKLVVPGRIVRKKAWNIGRRLDCDIVATVPWFPTMGGQPVTSGRFFTEAEMDGRAKVCIVEMPVARTLFPVDSALHKSIRIGTEYYRIIGIIDRVALKGKKGANGSSKDTSGTNRIYIPMTTADTQFGEMTIKRTSGSIEAERVEFHEAIVSVRNIENVVETGRIIANLLEMHHKKKDYEVIVPLTLLRQAEETTRIFNIVLGAIAGISLLVGGIGIMNIMLASVTERTREIGIRRALGAKRRNIVVQFLVETVLLSTTGGLIGVLLGVSIPYAITFFSEMKTIVTLWSPIIAFSISAIVGIVFGIYPAMRAANMDPVEALRHE